MRIPVLSEQGTADGRSDAEKRVIERHTADKQRTRVLPMFMNKTAFARSAGLTNIEQSYAVVLNRQGDVLTRVEGPLMPTRRKLCARHWVWPNKNYCFL